MAARLTAGTLLALLLVVGVWAALRAGEDTSAASAITVTDDASDSTAGVGDAPADTAEPTSDSGAPGDTAAAAETAETAAGESAAEITQAAGPDIETPPFLGAEKDLVGLDGWLQSDIESLDELDGTVHVVQFWTFGCFNCKNTLDNMAALYARHADDDFEVVGVHAPEFDFEKDPDSILAAAETLNVTWPIALDTEKVNFRSWQEGRRFWPRTFVVDQNGEIRFDRIGEGAYEKLNDTVAWLLANPPA